jgi:hypothetical protein
MKSDTCRLETLPTQVGERHRVPLGSYRGLRFGLILHPQFPPEVYLEGAITRQSLLSREHQGPRAILNAVERLASGYGAECDRVQQDLAIAEKQLGDYRERLGQPFPHDAVLAHLTTLRDRLKVCLSDRQPEPGTEPRDDASALAEQINALKTAQSLEAAPERNGHHRSTAEEPVTTRIRRRMGAVLASGSPAPHAEVTADPGQP